MIEDTCDKLISIEYKQGDVIIKQGDSPDGIYVIYKGTVGIFLGSNNKLGERTEKMVIGESSLDNDMKRTANVVALSDVIMLMLRKIDYESILLNYKKLEKHMNTKFLREIKFF